MSLSIQRFEEAAEKILNILDANPEKRDVIGYFNKIEGELYQAITLSGPESPKTYYQSFFMGKEVDYMGRLGSAYDQVKRYAEVSSNNSWFEFDIKIEGAKTAQISWMDKNLKVHHKEYFTFQPTLSNPEAGYLEILKFIESLPPVIKQLYWLAHNTGDTLSLKVPIRLEVLLLHQDSIVVHYRKKETGKDIREIVEKMFGNRGISLIREGRVKSGFDLYSLDKRYGASHSEILAKIATQGIINTWDLLRKRYIVLGKDGKKIFYKTDFAKYLMKLISGWSTSNYGDVVHFFKANNLQTPW